MYELKGIKNSDGTLYQELICDNYIMGDQYRKYFGMIHALCVMLPRLKVSDAAASVGCFN